MRTRILLALVCLIMLTGCYSKKQLQEEALALTTQHFKDTMIIEDDDFEEYATFSTRRGYNQIDTSAGHLLQALGGTLPENFLRGFIHKKTGLMRVQCYVNYRHHDGGWAYPYQANYGKPLHTEKVNRVSSDVDCLIFPQNDRHHVKPPASFYCFFLQSLQAINIH